MNDRDDSSNPPPPPTPSTPSGAAAATPEESGDETGNRALHKVAIGPNPHVERHEPASNTEGDKSPAGRW
jgi:hypothetical protein